MSTPAPNPDSATSLASAPPCAAPDLAQWFTREVHAHDQSLKAWIRGQFPSMQSEVEDIAQESYLRVWKARASHPIRSVKGFLFNVASHVAVDLLRRSKRSPVGSLGDLSVLDVLEDGPGVAATASLNEQLDILSDALVALPERCREVVMLRKLRLLSQKETAHQLQISERTVENHCRAGLIRLQAHLRERGIHNFQFE